MSGRGHLYALVLLAGCGLVACDPDDPCDRGYYADHGACLLPAPVRDPASDAGASDAAAPLDEQDFGVSCSSDADCGGSAPRCGAPQLPICTVVNCTVLDARCPASWNCLDISSWTPDAKIKSVCVNF